MGPLAGVKVIEFAHIHGRTGVRCAVHRSRTSPPGALGSAHPLSAPYQAFEAADGWITVGAANQTNWLRLLDALERDDLREDPRFADDPARMANIVDLVAILSAVFKRRPAADWLECLERAGVPAGPVKVAVAENP